MQAEPASRPGLPALYLITPQPAASDAAFLRGLDDALRARRPDLPLVQFRAHGLRHEHWRGLARDVLRVCRGHGARLLLNAGALDGVDAGALLEIGADGLHLPARLLPTQVRRGLACRQWLGASCHDAAQLRQAERIGADLVTLSPVLPTASHPGAQTLGWSALARLCRGSALPVYALGGLGAQHLERARAAGAHGVAAIRQLWPGDGGGQ